METVLAAAERAISKRMGKTFSSREFNQQVASAKRCAEEGPVFITDRGETTHVLLSVEEYRRIAKKPMTLAEMVSNPEVAALDDLEIPPRRVEPLRLVDFD